MVLKLRDILRRLHRSLERFSPMQIITMVFMLIILAGTLLLMLPCASKSGVSTDLMTALFIAIAFLITSTPLLYILLKKPGYYKKVFDEITAKETVQTSFKHKLFNTVFTLIFACCFCICISSWVCFIIFTLLFIGL